MVILHKGLVSIGIGAFKGCSSLERIMIPSTVNNHHGLQQIKPVTFSMCTSLLTVHIPSSMLEFADDAFYGCCCRLSLVFPQEITDFMSKNNIDWWKTCKLHNQVLTLCYLQTNNVLDCLSSMQSLAQQHIFDFLRGNVNPSYVEIFSAFDRLVFKKIINWGN